MTPATLNAALKGAGVGAIAACLLGCSAYAARGDRYSFGHFLMTLTGMTVISGLAAGVAIGTQDGTFEQGYQAALNQLETKLREAQNDTDLLAQKPSLQSQNGHVSKPI